jgi:hypothetical protein
MSDTRGLLIDRRGHRSKRRAHLARERDDVDLIFVNDNDGDLARCDKRGRVGVTIVRSW